MKNRVWKTAALIMCGGLLTQFSGCALLIAQAAAQNIILTFFIELVRQLWKGTAGNGGTTTTDTMMMLMMLR